ncbi:hypothetical protein HY490_00075 [Candidatus Woesearchaeota archaeon]|nr:hypothetical protein [Candidatus Woesearchaeota archaeon]
MNYLLAILVIFALVSVSVVLAGRMGGESFQCVMHDDCVMKDGRYYRWRECSGAARAYSGYMRYSQVEWDCNRIKSQASK